MKYISILFLLVFKLSFLFAQTPDQFKYQAVLRNTDGTIMTEENVTVVISILKSDLATSVFEETHNITTNSYGLINLIIGSEEDLGAVNWTIDEYFIEIKINGTIIGTTQLLSVPYALHAKTAETISGTITETDPAYTGSQAANITAADITNLSNLAGSNTGDQDISGITINASAITSIQSEQTEQDAIIAINTAKTGITTAQSDAITANTNKVGYTETLVSANADVVANTAKVGVTDGTEAGQMQYWDGSAWLTIASGKNEQILRCINGVPKWTEGNINDLVIGDYYQGGIIVYFLESGDPGYDANVRHGLIAATSDQSTEAEWGCWNSIITGADGTALGTGNQNTIDIEAGCTTEGTAADVCSNLLLNSYTDWYLPSKDELNQLYLNKSLIGGFTGYYWSSSEGSNYVAWLQNFETGSQSNSNKGLPYNARAVRAF